VAAGVGQQLEWLGRVSKKARTTMSDRATAQYNAWLCSSSGALCNVERGPRLFDKQISHVP
jgi:hypothetical protein